MKRGDMYEYLDIIVPMIMIFFVLLVVGMYANNGKKVADNHISEMADKATAHQDLINLLRLDLKDFILVSQMPAEVRDMTFAEFFAWYEMKVKDGYKMPSAAMGALNMGISDYFDEIHSDWNFRLESNGDVKHNYGKMPHNPYAYKVRLPSHSQSKLYAVLYLKNE